MLLHCIVHVCIRILRQSAAEQHSLLLLCKFLIFPENQAVLFVVYRIIRFFPLFKIIGIFIGDDGRTLFAELKVLVFDDTGIRSFAVGIVHDCIALKVFYIREVPVFESQAAVFQMSAA